MNRYWAKTCYRCIQENSTKIQDYQEKSDQKLVTKEDKTTCHLKAVTSFSKNVFMKTDEGEEEINEAYEFYYIALSYIL